MATIEELEQRSAEVAAAEVGAVERLVDDIRDVAVGLPEGSSLALQLMEAARTLATYGEVRRARYAANPLFVMAIELLRGLPPA